MKDRVRKFMGCLQNAINNCRFGDDHTFFYGVRVDGEGNVILTWDYTRAQEDSYDICFDNVPQGNEPDGLTWGLDYEDYYLAFLCTLINEKVLCPILELDIIADKNISLLLSCFIMKYHGFSFWEPYWENSHVSRYYQIKKDKLKEVLNNKPKTVIYNGKSYNVNYHYNYIDHTEAGEWKVIFFRDIEENKICI